MLRMSDPDAHGVVTVHADGVVSKENYDRTLPEFERLLDRDGRLRFLIDLAGVTGWQFGAAWQGLKFDARYRGRIGRTAVIGDSQWQDWATRVSSRLFEGEMRYFVPHEVEEARAWLRG